NICHITLERVSLGTLIVALGMLVDNAIVVTEGMMVRINRGDDRLKAAREVVGQTMWPLFGATLIAITAFAAISTSEDATGEFCRSLFQVIVISLLASWVTAVTLTPLLCTQIFQPQTTAAGLRNAANPYGSWLFRWYRRSLNGCLHHRGLTCAVMLALLALSIYGFGRVKHNFFPDSTRAQFFIELRLPYGSHIAATAQTARIIGEKSRKLPDVTMTAAFIGAGANRFLITYAPEKSDSSYAMILVSVDDWRKVAGITAKLQDELDHAGGNYLANVRRFILGPGEGGKIQARFSGRNGAELRRLANQAVAVMRADPDAKAIYSDWREKVKIIRPDFSEPQAGRAGLTYPEMAQALLENFQGVTFGVFREDDELLPIVARSPDITRNDISNIENTFIWSANAGKMVPVDQIVTGFDTVWEDPIIMRRNRQPTVTVHCDPAHGLPSTLFNRLRPQLEKIPLPPGYQLEFGGEYEDSAKANAGLAKNLPAFTIIMVLVVVFLFNTVRHPLIIWLTVPLTIIGVTFGLLVFHQPFGFMAMVGFISLSGMQIKNAIILLDEINSQIAAGKQRFRAVLDAAVSRIRPVSMAAFTTVLGMLPLLTDAFFVSMAVTIMCGLSFACLLTLYVVPVLYSIFFRVGYGADGVEPS
ncbi:MAG: efflux RND transporter permease subunit, partial [Victivallales bacterium]|nr:efflux RND transporter permease subunit [Victivallales bacterium]